VVSRVRLYLIFGALMRLYPFGMGFESVPRKLKQDLPTDSDMGRAGEGSGLLPVEVVPPAAFAARVVRSVRGGGSDLPDRNRGSSQEVVNDARRSPMWAQFEAMAQSAVYDAVITTDLQRRQRRWRPCLHQRWCCRGSDVAGLGDHRRGNRRRLPNASHRILPVEAVHGIDPGSTAAPIREVEQ
jgi:hypothetical protein